MVAGQSAALAPAPADPGGLWRALAVARVVLLGYAVVVNAVHWSDYRRPWVAAAVLGVLAVWTVLAPPLSAVRSRRPAFVVAEVALACAALLATPVAQGGEVLSSTPSVPSFWIAASVMAAGVRWGWPGGLIAAAVVTPVDLAVDVATRRELDATSAANVFLLVVTGLIVGYAARLVRIGAAERAEAAAERAATAERERLARAVHDGVLQTLAYVQRRGAEIGGPAAELAVLAGEQEASLRALVHAGVAGPSGAPDGACDVAALLHRRLAGAVSVATPGGPVPLPGPVAAEVVAAAQAALDNTRRHAPDATAYVLVEDEGSCVVVSVGDDGPGIAPGRLEEARADGRMGIAQSIRGRLAAIGGTAALRSAPGAGTEWELRVPRPAAERSRS